MRNVVLLPLLLLAGLSCNDKTTFRQVPIDGLPRCAKPNEMLIRPVIVEVEHDDGHGSQYYVGTEASPTFSLAERKDRLRVRVGLCGPVPSDSPPTIRCENPAWVGAPVEVTLDARDPAARLAVSVPGQHACQTN